MKEKYKIINKIPVSKQKSGLQTDILSYNISEEANCEVPYANILSI